MHIVVMVVMRVDSPLEAAAFRGRDIAVGKASAAGTTEMSPYRAK